MLDEIEADLLRCQAVLASSGGLPDGPQQGVSPGQRSNASETPAAFPQAAQQHLPVASPGQKNQPRSVRGRLTTPPEAGKPKPKNMAALLAMLEDAPAGPVEIDPAILYSPQSSADLHGSPSGSTLGGYSVSGGSPAVLRKGGSRMCRAPRQEFSLKAYRPSAEGGADELADAFGSSLHMLDGLRSPGSQRSLDWDAKLQHHEQLLGGQGASGLLSPADSEIMQRLSQRPLSAPSHHATPPSPSVSGSLSRGPAPASLRQLHLDDVIAAGVRGSTAGLLRAGREARLQQLAEPRKELWEKCAMRKLEEEEQELKECTFAPRVGRPPESHKHQPDMPVDERLYRRSEGKWEALERAKAAQDSAQLVECTFAPQLNQPDKHLRREYTPIHKRVGEEQRKRSVKLAQMRVLEDLTNPNTTFTPRLNPRSLQLAAEKEERELYSSTAAGSMWRSRSFAAEAPHDEGCTFSPSLNPASQRLLEDSATVPADFQERLRFYTMRRDMKQRQMQEEQDAQACTFHPDTGNAVEVLAFSARAGNLLESGQERCERMALEEAAALGARRAAKEREIYGAMDFKPQLNPRSLRMAKASTVEELASAVKTSRKVAYLRAAEEQRLRQECTFRPNTAKPRVKGYGDEYEEPQPKAKLTIAGQGFDGILERIHDYQAEKEAKAARAKEEQQRRQLQECSFAPAINRQPPANAKGPVVVRGLDRYLELKQLAERHKKEAEERAAQVFRLNPKSPAAPRTVPHPFKLSGLARLEQRAQAKQSEVLQSTVQQRMQQCPFRPQTNHSKRQQALAEMLGHQDAADLAFV